MQYGSVHTINNLESAADAYIATDEDDPRKGRLWEAVVEWMAYSYEQDGYTDEQLERMDIESAAEEYVERRALDKS